ncbi:variable surface protein [Plasmodium gonderi]|uniref:Variable surface protein n=1 Tax=Plasmodium gonderi TaxID=77519 RepID=A0A1Y1JT92_PLAGO|nr:variable surface protein [Plasmodium gonderi]GAW84357.1 variable surface protein [Plasmodium gonderi]
MARELGDDDLKKLPTKVKYALFDEVKENCDDDSFYRIVNSRIGRENWIYNVSDKIPKALCYVYKKSLANGFDQSICNYLYYWLIDVLYKNLKFRHSIHPIMELFKFLLKRHNGMDICNYDNYEITQDNFMYIKLIFDFSKDYDKLKEYFRMNHRLCSSEFKKYFDQYIITYNTYKSKCKLSRSKDGPCMAFEKYSKNIDYGIISKWSCTSKGNIRNSSTSQKKGGIERPDIRRGVHAIKKVKEIYEEVSINVTKETVEIGDAVIKGYPEQVQEVTIPQGGNISYSHSHGSGRYDDTLEFKTISYISNNTSASSASKGMVITPILVGIAVFSIILYKVIINFTPAAYWFKKVLLGKSKGKRNIIMDKDIIEYYMITENLDSPRRFNVKYSNI